MKLFKEESQSAERHAAIRTLNHTYVVDRIFAATLQRLKHEYTATNTTETPTLDQLGSSIKGSDAWYVDYASTLTPKTLSESIDFAFTDGALGRMTREEMLAHLLLHGDYHRGSISQSLAQFNYPTPKPFTGFLHLFEPTTRRRG